MSRSDELPVPQPTPGTRAFGLPGTLAQRWNAFAVAACGAVVLVMGYRHRWTNDDALIYTRAVRQILAGNGPVFNVQERAESSTGTLWQWLLAAGGALPGVSDPLRLAVALGLLLTVAGYLLALDGTRRMLRIHRPTGALLPAGVLVLLPLCATWDYATSGLETGLSFAYLGGAWWLLVRARTLRAAHEAPAGRGRPALAPTAFALGLGPLVRPDLALVSGVFLAALWLLWRPPLRTTLGWAGAAAALPCAYEIFRAGYYGVLVPLPALAKEASGTQWQFGWDYLRNTLDPYLLWIPLSLLAGYIGYRAYGVCRARGASAMAGTPAAPDASAALGTSATAGTPTTPDTSAGLGTSATTGTPDTPETSAALGTSATTGAPATSTTSAEPDAPAPPGTSAEPGGAVAPGTSATPGTTGALGTPATFGTAVTPGSPAAPGTVTPGTAAPVGSAIGVGSAVGASLPHGVPVRRWVRWWGGTRDGRAAPRPYTADAVLVGAPVAAGLLSAFFVVKIGGDFMHGRMVLPALFLLLLPIFLLPLGRAATVLAGALAAWAVVCGLLLRPPLESPDDPRIVFDSHTVYQRVLGDTHPVGQSAHTERRLAFSDAARHTLRTGRHALVLRLPHDAGYPVVPLAPHVRAPVAAAEARLGHAGAVLPLDGFVIDTLGLSNPLGAHTEPTSRRKAGHEKPLDRAWVVADVTAPGTRVPGVDPDRVRAARHALTCGPLPELLASAREPLTPGRFWSNLTGAWDRTRFRIPADPVEAERRLC
ncbi:hypothetical protein QLX52_06005 [Streptomyces albus]|uniref:hypothetical protein n=1 Tax=Streptomyces albus TaxID=1888 RepID=UPI0024ACC200|nr:hypothetical protein [Streptomyces albus]MDI6408390.1 hypothetical protein [Streptomyces albus]